MKYCSYYCYIVVTLVTDVDRDILDDVDGFPDIQDKIITSSGRLVSIFEFALTPLVLSSFD